MLTLCFCRLWTINLIGFPALAIAATAISWSEVRRGTPSTSTIRSPVLRPPVLKIQFLIQRSINLWTRSLISKTFPTSKCHLRWTTEHSPQIIVCSSYIFAVWCRRYFICLAANSVRFNNLSLKYLIKGLQFAPPGCKDIWIGKLEFVRSVQILLNR